MNNTELWLCGGTALTMAVLSREIENSAIGIRDGRIFYVGSCEGAPIAVGSRIVDTGECLVMPGLINSHTHAGLSLLRGVADDLPLDPWLNTRIFPLERQWGGLDWVRVGTSLGCLEMIRSGTTTFNDMYYFESTAAEVGDRAGLRMIAGQTIIEVSGVDGGGRSSNFGELIGPLEIFLEEIANYPRVTAALTPHSIYGVSLKTWEKTIEFAHSHDLLIHTHLSETKQEMHDCWVTYGKTPTQVFEKIGLFSGRTVAAHATCVTQNDIEILARHGVGVSHNVESNLKLGTRICPVVALRAAGVNVAIGTDSTASNNNLDLFQEADTVAKLQVLENGVGALRAREVVRMLTSEGAAAIGLGAVTGSLEVGKRGDVIAVDVSAPHSVPLYDPYSHLVYSAVGSDVKHSVVDGRVLMEDRKVLTLDEKEILAEARSFGKRISEALRLELSLRAPGDAGAKQSPVNQQRKSSEEVF